MHPPPPDPLNILTYATDVQADLALTRARLNLFAFSYAAVHSIILFISTLILWRVMQKAADHGRVSNYHLYANCSLNLLLALTLAFFSIANLYVYKTVNRGRLFLAVCAWIVLSLIFIQQAEQAVMTIGHTLGRFEITYRHPTEFGILGILIFSISALASAGSMPLMIILALRPTPQRGRDIAIKRMLIAATILATIAVGSRALSVYGGWTRYDEISKMRFGAAIRMDFYWNFIRSSADLLARLIFSIVMIAALLLPHGGGRVIRIGAWIAISIASIYFLGNTFWLYTLQNGRTIADTDLNQMVWNLGLGLSITCLPISVLILLGRRV